MEHKYRSQVDALHSRTAELESEARQLREAKFGLEARVAELTRRLAAAEGSTASLEAEAERLRQDTMASGREKVQRETDISELRAKLSAAEGKVCSQSRNHFNLWTAELLLLFSTAVNMYIYRHTQTFSVVILSTACPLMLGCHPACK